MRRSFAIFAIIAIAFGCGPGGPTGAFTTQFPDNQAEPTADLARSLPAPGAPALDNARGVPLAVVTTHTEPRAVVAFEIESQRELWRTPLNAMTRPEILGDVVVTSARTQVDGENVDQIVALDLANGRELWREDTEGQAYVGSAREGGRLVLVTSTGAAGGSTRVARILAVGARNGTTAWQHEITGILGQPAIRGGLVFVPYERQNIAILGLADGLEKIRLRSTDDVIAWVTANNQGVFYGSNGIYRFAPESASGTKAGSLYRAPPMPQETDSTTASATSGGETAAPAAAAEGAAAAEDEITLPFEAPIHDDGFFPKPGARSARGRIRTYFAIGAPTEGNPLPLVENTLYVVYYRFVFAFDGDRHLKWTRILGEDAIGAQVVQTGLLTVGEQGAINVLDPNTGNDRFAATLGAELASVAIDAATFAPTGEPGEARDLRQSLVEISVHPDNRLVAARGLALTMLARIDEPEITRDLLDLYAQRSMPSALRAAIERALRRRRSGAEFLVQALDRHYDFIENTIAPPLELIVPSLLEMQAREAVPGLIQQMQDHETPLEVLPTLINAIVELGDASVVPPLTAFLALYRADSTFGQNPQALAIAAEGIFKHGGTEGREALTRLAADGRTGANVSEAIRGLFEREARAAEQLAQRQAQEEEAARLAAQRREEAERPLTLSQEVINQTLAEHADEFRGCIMEELGRNPELAEVRFVFIINGDGTTRDHTFAPSRAEFTACVQPKLADVHFPPFRQSRQRARFAIALRGDAPEPTQAEPDDSDQPWWVRMRARVTDGSPAASASPWWRRHNATRTNVVASNNTTGNNTTGNNTTGNNTTGNNTTNPRRDAGAETPVVADAATPPGRDGGARPPDAATPPARDAGAPPPPDAEPVEEEPENPWWLPAQ